MNRPLLLVAAVLVVGVTLIHMREGNELYNRFFSPPAFRLLLEDEGSIDGASLSGKVTFSETGEEGIIFRLETDDVGTIRCTAPLDIRCPLPGEQIRVTGSASLFNTAENPGMFDTRAFYDAQKVWFQMEVTESVTLKKSDAFLSVALHGFREKARQVIRENASDEDAPIFLTLFSGDKSELTEEDKDAGDYGLSFLISFAGLHVTVLVGAVCRFFRKLTDKWHAAAAAVLLSVILYLFTGRSASVFRGAVVASCRALAPVVKRKFDYVSAGALALILLILDMPGFVFLSSFAYGFSSLLAIGLFYPAIRTVFYRGNGIWPTVFFVLSLQCFLLPVRLFTSYEFVILSPVLSALSMVIFPFLLASVYAGTFAGFLCSMAAKLLYAPGHIILLVLRSASSVLEKTKLIKITGRPDRWKMIVYFGALAAVYAVLRVIFMKNRKLPESDEAIPSELHYRAFAAILISIFAAGLLFLGCSQPKNGSILLALSVGQGDCNLILTGEHCAVVIDCGNSFGSNLYEKRVRPTLRYYGIRDISAVFISHPDTDHISGLSNLISDYGAGIIFFTEGVSGETDFIKLLNQADKLKIPVSGLKAGDMIKIPNAGTVTVLWPEAGVSPDNSNDLSLVLLYEEYGMRALYTGDISSEDEEKLVLPVDSVDYLKVAHHGSKYSTSEAFLKAVAPRVASISCSKRNTYGHPSPETLKRLKDSETEVHILCNEGAFVLYFGE